MIFLGGPNKPHAKVFEDSYWCFFFLSLDNMETQNPLHKIEETTICDSSQQSM